MLEAVSAGDVSSLRIDFMPTSVDGRFGVFQLHVQGVPLGDGSTTAWYPHYQDLERLALLARQPGTRRRQRLALGDTFDHLYLYIEMTQSDIIFTFTTRPADQWGSPPPRAPKPDQWMRLRTTRLDFLALWRTVRPQFDGLLPQGE